MPPQLLITRLVLGANWVSPNSNFKFPETGINWASWVCCPPCSDQLGPEAQSSGEGNGTPLQYSCLENPMDGGAWCSPWGREESDTSEWLPFHFSLSWIGEENGNPLQCSCLENPRDRGAWWAAIYGVAQSRTRLKGFSSSSDSRG